MEIVFSVFSKNGKYIRLTEKQWKHISSRHPEMSSKLNEINTALQNPTFIRKHSNSVDKFYRFLKKENKYIMVAVKILNGDGFVITAYKVKSI